MFVILEHMFEFNIVNPKPWFHRQPLGVLILHMAAALCISGWEPKLAERLYRQSKSPIVICSYRHMQSTCVSEPMHYEVAS